MDDFKTLAVNALQQHFVTPSEALIACIEWCYRQYGGSYQDGVRIVRRQAQELLQEYIRRQ